MTNSPPGIEIDLLVYVRALFNAKWWILIAAIVSGAISGYHYSKKPNIYEGLVKVNLISPDDPGGVSPDNRRAAEVLTLVEHGFVLGSTKDNHLAAMLTRLRSRQFTVMFMEEQKIYSHMDRENWDSVKQQWNTGYRPDKGGLAKHFVEQVRFVEHDPDTDLIFVKMHWHDPELARNWANTYVAMFNEYMRKKTLDDVEKKLVYLREQLERQDVLEIEKSIYRLIEAQMAVAMLASARQEFALEVLDPAARAYEKVSPKRKRMIILYMFAAVLLTIFAVIGRVLFKRLQTALRQIESPDYSTLDESLDPAPDVRHAS